MSEHKVVCPTCGKVSEGDFHYCPDCGGKMPQVNDQEKRAIDSAINELFVDDGKKEDKLDILPLSKKQEIIQDKVKKKKPVPPIKKQDKSNLFSMIAVGLSVVVIGLLLFLGYQVFFADKGQPKDPVVPPIVNPDKPIDKPESKDPEVNKPTDPIEPEKPKGPIELAFTMGDSDVLASVNKIEFEIKDTDAYRFNFYYESTEAITMTFGDASASFEPIGIDVPAGNSYVYFDLGKSLIKKDNAMTLTLYQQGTSENGKRITIEAETINQLLKNSE